MSRSAAPARILVADDHPDAAELMAMLVSIACPGAETQIARDGDTCLKIAHEWQPQLVITDIDMPVLNGVQAAVKMRKLLGASQPAIVAVTGDPRWTKDPMALTHFDALLVKPVDLEALMRWCRGVLQTLTVAAGRQGLAPVYRVRLEGGAFDETERSVAVERYRQALEWHYGSSFSVVDAMQSTDRLVMERWVTAKAYARWTALGPIGFAGKGTFIEESTPASSESVNLTHLPVSDPYTAR